MRLISKFLAVLPISVMALGYGEAKAQYVYYASPVVQVYGAITPFIPAQPIMAAPVVDVPPAPREVDTRAPVARLQIALGKLGFYQCPVTGERDKATSAALSSFLQAVPADVRQRFGNQVAAMAEAATRHEFPLGGR